ncbi:MULTISPECIES: signal peptidase I [unclassified Microbacterium]|uniref:signal peptidase I n=1 Tax=unclassified Microbacterium TaxID=2609290 RepID=UPI001E17FA15|nr:MULTISPECIES: signal peptidase I [unclassified Microbacterium]MBT9605331.1 signal peptidase I [Microbacterium sp.]CAH0171981.1 Signal peptidase I [Microbacterium sp. Bi128]
MSDETAAAPASAPTTRRRRGALTFARDVVVILLIALVVSFLVKTFVVRSFYIPSASMNNTLLQNDRILVDELTPRFGDYSRGDVVVFRDPGGWLPVTPQAQRPPLVEATDWLLSLVGLSAPDSDDHLIKRVIGTPGDHVVCCNALGQTTVNGVPLEESYVKLSPGATAPEPFPYDITVPDGSLWVLGDNRNSSKDSRYNQEQPGKGFVPIDNVVGRAFVITWPFDRFGLIDFHHEVFAGVPAPESAP